MHDVTSKTAIVVMTRVMARELDDNKINVNAIMPGCAETEIEHARMGANLLTTSEYLNVQKP